MDDSKWVLDYTSTQVGGYVCQNLEVLQEEIKSLLKGDDISTRDFNLIYRHIALENRINKGAHQNAKKFIAAIRFYGFHQQRLSADVSKWQGAKDKLAELLVCDNVNVDFDMCEDDLNLKGDAISSLREFGYEISVEKGRFAPTVKDECRFGEAMRYRFDKVGAVSIEIVLDRIRHLYREDTGRYDFRPEPATIGKPYIVPPWGYLLNVALSFIHRKQRFREDIVAKTFNQILDLSTKYFTVLELQPLSKIADAFRAHEEIIDEIAEGILYNQHIALDQYPLEVIFEIIKRLEDARDPEGNNPIVCVLEWICKQKKCERPQSLRFTRFEIMQGLSDSLSVGQVIEILDSLTIQDSELNKGYYVPHEVCKRNYYKRPFVLMDGYYVLWDSNLWAKGFYHVWLEKYGKGVNLGGLFESVVQKLLVAKNIKFIAGGKYAISNEERIEFGITSKEGECDFVIDTPEKVYFIELKMKEITGNAMAGDGLAALTDMSKSVLTAFIQAAKHELILRRRGEIEFDSANKIELGSKRVEKIHVSAFDRYGLHDKLLVERLVTSIIRCDFNCPEEQKISEFKKVQRQIRAIVSNKVVSEAYRNGSYLHTFRSFSLPQLMFALQGCKSEIDFARNLDMTSRVITGMKDWYNEQIFMTAVRKS